MVFKIGYCREIQLEIEMLNKEITMSGINSIGKGENPRLIKSKLESFLAPKDREAEEA